MIKLLKKMGKREVLMAVLCALLVLGQVYFDLTLPDYMTDLTMMLNTAGSETSDILNVGLKMLGCTLASAALAIVCGYLSAKTASGFSYTIREKLFNHVMDMGSEEMQDFSIPSLITRTTNDITQIQMIVSMGLQMIIKSPIMAVWAVIKILGKSWELSAYKNYKHWFREGLLPADTMPFLRITEAGIQDWGTLVYRKDDTLEKYLHRAGLSREDRYAFDTYALLDSAGWKGSGDMGWFGIISNSMEEREWQDEIQAFLADLDDTVFLVSVDCHI